MEERQPRPLPCARTLDLKVSGSRPHLIIIIIVVIVLASSDFNQRFSEPVGLGPQLLRRVSVAGKAEKWPPRWCPPPRA